MATQYCFASGHFLFAQISMAGWKCGHSTVMSDSSSSDASKKAKRQVTITHWCGFSMWGWTSQIACSLLRCGATSEGTIRTEFGGWETSWVFGWVALPITKWVTLWTMLQATSFNGAPAGDQRGDSGQTFWKLCPYCTLAPSDGWEGAKEDEAQIWNLLYDGKRKHGFHEISFLVCTGRASGSGPGLLLVIVPVCSLTSLPNVNERDFLLNCQAPPSSASWWIGQQMQKIKRKNW